MRKDNAKYYRTSKNAYNSDSCLKSIKVVFPTLNLSFENNQVLQESFTLKESILDSDSLEFVGCIASYMTVQIQGLDADVKGLSVKAYVKDDITNTELPLFCGVVESSKKKGFENTKIIEAYDILYSLNNVDATEFYNNHEATTISDLLNEIAEICSIPLSSTLELPNGTLTAFCGTYQQVTQLSVLKLLKYICQINGGFGRINRYGQFELIYLNEPLAKKKYPNVRLFPMHDGALYPNQPGEIQPDVQIDLTFPFYKSCEFDEYNVLPINKILIRDNEAAEGVFYGVGQNQYIIQGNIFAMGHNTETLQRVGHEIYVKTNGISFTPFESDNYGLPFIECGDNVFYMDLENDQEIKRSFFVFKRELRGIQCMNDYYSAEGQENQSIFITDLGSQIESIRNEQKSEKEQSKNEIEELKRRIARLEAIVGAFRTVTGLIKEKPVVEATNMDVVTKTIATLEDNNE